MSLSVIPITNRGSNNRVSQDSIYIFVYLFAPGRRLSVIHTVEFEGFDGSDFLTLRGQICTTQGPKVKFVMQVDI